MKKTANYLLVSLGLMMAISACKTNLGGEKIIAIDVSNIDLVFHQLVCLYHNLIENLFEMIIYDVYS
jgi:hypothetical protein